LSLCIANKIWLNPIFEGSTFGLAEKGGDRRKQTIV